MVTVYRIQPIGSDLHGIETETSNGELAGGVHVFETLQEVYGCREWDKRVTDVELVTIACEQRDLRSNGDYEGVTLRKGRGQIVERLEFSCVGEIVEWLEERI